MKRRQGPAGLTGNGAAEQTGAVVDHGDDDHVGRGVNAVFHKQRGQTVGIIHLRHHRHGLTGRRQDRAVFDVGNGRAGVGLGDAVGRARAAEIPGGQNIAGRFEPVAAQAEQDFRPAAQPADFRPDRGGLARIESGLEPGSNPVCSCVAVPGGANVQAMRAEVAFGRLQSGIFMIALWHPARQARFKVGIGNPVRAAGRKYLDIVHQAFPGAQHDDLQ